MWCFSPFHCTFLALLLPFIGICSAARRKLSRPIHIGLAVDEHSFRDALLLMSSVAESAFRPRELFFHVAAVGKDESAAQRVREALDRRVAQCLSFFEHTHSSLSPAHSVRAETSSGEASAPLHNATEEAEEALRHFFSSAYHTHVSAAERASFARTAALTGAERDRVRYESVAFILPTESGFAAQLRFFKRRAHSLSHWNSHAGADFARFYLPSLFPETEKLLYLDNDVVVTCCVEEMYDAELGVDKAVGLALDDLKWAVATQFARHYNASHPLVVRHMRRSLLQASSYSTHTKLLPEGESESESEVSKELFTQLVPRYPNDGVLLFNTSLFLSLSILEEMDEIARANGRGEFVVNAGTQQFTVLALHDRWQEMTPRANLRHFPDMARGYLMWFSFHGAVHYAGQSKPRTICAMDRFKESNSLRVQSYTAWLNNHYQLAMQCGRERDFLYQHCIDSSRDDSNKEGERSTEGEDPLADNKHNHVVHARTAQELFFFVEEMLAQTESQDAANLYVKIVDDSFLGRCSPSEKHDRISKVHEDCVSEEALSRIAQSNAEFRNVSFASRSSPSLPQNVLASVESMLLFESLWSWRVFHTHTSPTSNTHNTNSEGVERVVRMLQSKAMTHFAAAEKEHKKSSKQQREAKKRAFSVSSHVSLCRAEGDVYVPLPLDHPFTFARNETDFRPLYLTEKTQPETDRECVSVLPQLKRERRQHWDPVALSVSLSSQRRTLQALFALDLVFLRPRLVIVHLAEEAGSHHTTLSDNILSAMRYLRRNGFLPSHQRSRDGEAFVWGVRANKLDFR